MVKAAGGEVRNKYICSLAGVFEFILKIYCNMSLHFRGIRKIPAYARMTF